MSGHGGNESAAERLDTVRDLGRRIAHDLNNALGVISAHASLALMSVEDDPDLREDVEAIRDAGRRAATLVREIMALLPKSAAATSPKDATEMVTAAEGLLRRVLGQDIELSVALTHDDTGLACEEIEVQQILLGFGARAREAMPDGGTVRVEVARVGVVPDGGAEGVPSGPHVSIALEATGRGSERQGAAAWSGLEGLRAAVARAGGTTTVEPGRVELRFPAAGGSEV